MLISLVVGKASMDPILLLELLIPACDYCRKVGFVKIKADCSLIDGKNQHSKRLPGICFLRGNAVAILTALHCSDGETYSLLVEQPR